MTPPWQSPDEPRHFEYVESLSQIGQSSLSGNLSLSIEKQIILSMYQFDFWRYAHRPAPQAVPASFDNAPLLSSAHSQLEYQPPLYYVLSSLVYHVASSSSLVAQLLVLRIFSVLIGTLVVLFAYLVCKELFPDDRFLSLAVSSFIALSPMYWFIAGAVNNDVLATAAVSALVYVLVRALKRSVGLLSGILIVLLVLVALASKRTAVIAIPLTIAWIPFYLWVKRVTIPRNWRLVFLAAIAVLFLAAWQVIWLTGEDAEGWQELDHHWMDSRSSTYSRSGNHSFHVAKDSDTWQYIAQFIDADQVSQLKGKSVTLQTWVRGAGNNQSGFIMVSDGVGSKIQSFQASSEWRPVELSYDVSPAAKFVRVALGPGNASPKGKGDVYFDDITLTDGLEADGPTNYVRNGSAEVASWRWQNSRVVQYMSTAIAGWTALIEGRDMTSDILGMYWKALTTAFQSFWGVFGWMAAPLGEIWYQVILIVLLAGFAGLLLSTVRNLQGQRTVARHQEAGLWLLLVSVLLGVGTILITHNPAAFPNTLPQGRYLFPILVPGAILFMLGIEKLVPLRYRGLGVFCCVSGFFLFNSAVLITQVIPFFYG